ncbi:CBASS effector endonuclease NucC, partial [Pseudomonas aeruginosa]
VFEAKQTADAALVAYAQEKVASVRRLHRTSLPIPHAGGTYPAKPLIPILGGLLTFESEWSPALGPSMDKALKAELADRRLDVGCVAAHGHFFHDPATGNYSYINENKPATAFLFKLIAQLQFSGTVPMIDVEAYG